MSHAEGTVFKARKTARGQCEVVREVQAQGWGGGKVQGDMLQYVGRVDPEQQRGSLLRLLQ